MGESSGSDVYCNNHCNNDFSDIRFTKADRSTFLDYWIESYNNESASVWVKLDHIPTSTSSGLFNIYYGNPYGTSASNGSNTFLFFDDFIGLSLDPAKWTIIEGTPSISNSICKLIPTSSTSCIIRSTSQYGVNTALRGRLKSKHYATGSGVAEGFQYEMPRYQAGVYYDNHYYPGAYANANNSPDYWISSGGWSAGTFHIQDIRRNGDKNTVFSVDDANIITLAINVPTLNLTVRAYAANEFSSQGAELDLDWVTVRNITPNEPTFGRWIIKSSGQ
jgi:hypothetical protein